MSIKPGDLIRDNTTGHPSIVLRWPRDRADWTPLNDPSDEWVVLWIDPSGLNNHSSLELAGGFTVVGIHPAIH